MKPLILSIAASFLVLHSGQADPEIKGSPAELANYLSNIPRIVAVTGEGQVKAQADRARVTLRIATEHKSLADALRANEQIRGRLAAFLQEHGIGGDRLRPSKFSSIPKYGLLSEKVRLQRVENQIEVTVRDEKEFQAVAAAPDKFPEATYVSAEFEHSDKDKLRTQAIREACDDADRHKRLFEEKFGLKLTPRGFTEQFLGRSTARDRVRAQGGSAPSYTATYAFTPLPGYGEGGSEAVEAISSFGELNFKVAITVQYSAEPMQKP